MSKFVCKHSWTHFEVNNPNGDVTMCCDNSTVLGNVNQGSIEEIWNGRPFQDIRRQMRDQGAHSMCPHTCPVLNGQKNFQNLDWYAEVPEGAVRANAALNEREFDDGKLVLDSKPRWMRFCYSYACNLDCYHCYQREDAKINLSLPDHFIQQIRDQAAYYQVVYFFGGEPFMYKPVTRMMGDLEVAPECRYFIITNATLLTEPVFAMLETKNIGIFAVSLDAATAQSFDVLRVRGRNGSWDGVMANVRRIAELRQRKGFVFTLSMTVNSVNYAEIESFVDLALALEAEPVILLVANPDQTTEFQQNFLFFTPQQLDTMQRQIERSLVKLAGAGLENSRNALKQLRNDLRFHQHSENSPVRYRAKTVARKVLRSLPAPLQSKVRGWLALIR